MLHSEWVSLIELLATNNTDIQHGPSNNRFGYFDMTDILANKLRNLSAGKCVMVEREDGSFTDPDSDNMLDKKLCAFHIVHLGEGKATITQLAQLYGECEAIAKNFIAKMIHMGEDEDHPLLQFLDKNSFTYMMVGTELWNASGVSCRVEFALLSKDVNLKYNPAKWA